MCIFRSTLPRERFVTYVAAIWLLTSVNKHVYFHISSLRERFGAYLAGMGLLSEIHQLVPFKIARRCEAFVALVTCMGRLLASVPPHVVIPRARLCEGFGTLVTNECLLTSVLTSAPTCAY